MLENWPDAISCENISEETNFLYLVSQTTVEDPNLILYGSSVADPIYFEVLTGLVADIEQNACVATTSDDINDTGIFTQYDFGGNAVATTTTVVNPTQDLFTGIVLFFAVMWFIIWFFRRPYDSQ